MKHYDDIVVGSGISGLTLAHLLGLNGRKVLLLEKSVKNLIYKCVINWNQYIGAYVGNIIPIILIIVLNIRTLVTVPHLNR